MVPTVSQLFWQGGEGEGAPGAGERIAVHFVVAGQLPEFRAVEALPGMSAIEEMPVHISELSLAWA